MNRKNLCYKYLLLDIKTIEFIYNVPTIGEESISDWLIWKWREIDKNFNYIKLNLSPFTKKQEAKNGADLELWIIMKIQLFHCYFKQKKLFICMMVIYKS